MFGSNAHETSASVPAALLFPQAGIVIDAVFYPEAPDVVRGRAHSGLIRDWGGSDAKIWTAYGVRVKGLDVAGVSGRTINSL